MRADWDEAGNDAAWSDRCTSSPRRRGWFCPGLAISRDEAGAFVVAWKEAEAFVDSVFSESDD